MSRTVIKYVIIITLLGGVSSCRVQETATSQFNSNPKTRWLRGEPCLPPCWENIQPRTTRPDEAIKLLKAVPTIEQTTLQVAEDPDVNFGGITWKFSSDVDYWEGTISYFLDEDRVNTIKLFIPDLCLHEIIDAYGEPDYLLSPEAYESLGVVNLFWESRGFTFQAETQIPGVSITENTCGGMLNQFSVGIPLEKIPSIYLMGGLDTAIVPWTGYGSYSE